MIGVHRALRAAVSWFLLAQLAAGLAPHAAEAAERPSMVIIFDATNSMWTQIEGANKVVLLRQALEHAFEAARGKLDMGLISYGSNELQACGAIKTVHPLGPVDPTEYARAVDRVGLGKGGTPLGQALGKAAELAEAEARPATIVVISDGLDNCRTDPCATAAQLKARSPDLTIHAIAFDRGRADQLAALSCMAEATGGTFHAATNGDELDSALNAAVALAAKGSRPPAAAEKVAVVDSAATAAQEAPTVPLPPIKPNRDAEPGPDGSAPQSPPNLFGEQAAGSEDEGAAPQEQAKLEVQTTGTLRLSASLTEDLAPLTGGLVWRIFSAEPDQDGAFTVIAHNTNARPQFVLRTGDYVVHVAYGRAKTAKRITVTDGVVDETLVLNAGGLRLSAVRSDGRPIPPGTLSFAVYSSEQDQFGQRKLILPTVPKGKIVRLNAGTYRVVSQFGDANAVVRADVTIEAGKLSDAVVTHEAAKVTLKLVNEAGGEALADTSWSVETPQGDVVAQSVGAFPSHILAPGEYTIVARHDRIAYSRKYTVETGYDQDVEIVVGPEETAVGLPPTAEIPR